jgi:hypothetical protein
LLKNQVAADNMIDGFYGDKPKGMHWAACHRLKNGMNVARLMCKSGMLNNQRRNYCWLFH